MKKLVSIIAGSLIGLSGCSVSEDQVRIPNTIPVHYKFSDKEVRKYENMFGVDTIIEVKEKDNKKTYVSCCGNLEDQHLKFYEFKRDGRKYRLSKLNTNDTQWSDIEKEYNSLKKDMIVENKIRKALDYKKKK